MAAPTKHNNTGFGNHVGTSSILLIFIVLCLVSFAGLSLVSANADYTLTAKIASRTSSYYSASNKAQDVLAELDSIAFSAYQDCDFDIQNYFRILGLQTLSLSDNSSVLIEGDTKNCGFSFSEFLSETQQLYVAGHFVYPESLDGPFYVLDSYQVITDTTAMDYQDTLPVMQ